jgi:hypothetical protein
MEQAYQAHGLERSGDFHDISDHLSLLLEFTAHLFSQAATGNDGLEREAGEFLRRFVVPWMGEWAGRIERAISDKKLAAPYLYLARLLGKASALDAELFAPETEQAPKPKRRQTRSEAVIGDPETAAKCRICGTPFLREKQLALMIELLRAQGLGTDHLDTCPNCRTSAMGLTPLDAPTLRKPKRRGA